jgi:hypothetical protein
LKLSKLTDDIIDEPYEDIMRKFQTYRALDGVETATPIVAYPVLSEEGGRTANTRVKDATNRLYGIIGYEETTGAVEQPQVGIDEDLAKSILGHEAGEEMIDIEDLMRDM